MSLTSLLSIARTALLAHQKAVDVTGHNIANANTEGFSRQRLVLEPQPPIQTPIGQLGRGVAAVGVERIRDEFLDASYRRENADLGRFTTLRDLLGRLESIFGEPSDSRLAVGIDQFLSAFGDLANDPTGGAPRVLVVQAAQYLRQQFRDAERRVGDVGQEVVARMQEAVSEINAIARQVADFNIRIQSRATGFRDAPDLKDQRDQLLDRLSSLMSVRVI